MEEPAHMLTPKVSGLRLEFSDGRAPVTALEEINDTLAPFGSCAWPLDYGSVASEMRKLIAQPSLSEVDSDAVMQNFLLPRQRLLKLIAISAVIGFPLYVWTYGLPKAVDDILPIAFSNAGRLFA